MKNADHTHRLKPLWSSCLVIAGLCVPICATSQDIPANPLAITRPMVEPVIPKLIIEQAVFSASACEPADLERNISLRELRITRFSLAEQSQETSLPSELEASLLEEGTERLELNGANVLSGVFSLCQLREVASALTRKHQEQTGQIVSRVIIPAQDITDGTLELQVLEGRLESFNVVGADQDGVNTSKQRTADAMQALLGDSVGEPLLGEELERALILAGETTGQQVAGSLQPGQQTMGTVLEVDVQPLPRLQGGVTLDNYGSPATGEHQVGASLSFGSALFAGDRISASYFTSQDQSAISSYSVSYELPIGYSGWRGGWRSTRTQYALPGDFSATQARGDARSNGLYLSYALQRRLNARADALVGFNQVDLQDSSVVIDNQRTAKVLWSEVRGVSRDATGSNSWGLGFTIGNLRYSTPALTRLDTAGPQREGTYRILSYDYKRQQLLAKGFDATFSVRGQMSSKNLDSYHKFGLGGVNSVRAFASGEVSGDSGYITRFEIGYTPSGLDGNRFSLFHDRGSVRIDKSPLALNASSNAVHLSGSGLQWEAAFSMNTRIRVFIAKPQGGDRTTSAVDNKGTRVGADLSYVF